MAILKVAGVVVGFIVALGVNWFIQIDRANKRRNAVIDARNARIERVQTVTVHEALV